MQPVNPASLFERYHQEVYRLCLGMLGDPHDAEDATQEVFLRVQRAWHSYDPQRAAPRTWLGQITMNHCRSVLRRRRLWGAVQHLFWRAADDSGWSANALDARADISAALGLLDERHRSVVLLRYYLELPCADIAAILDINEGTVRSRLSVARQRMRAMLEQQGYGHEQTT